MMLHWIRLWLGLLWREQRGSQGTQVAGVALAAALIGGAGLWAAQDMVAPAVDRAMDCAAAVLQGGGATCASAAASSAAEDAAADNDLSQEFLDAMAQFFEDLQNGDIGWIMQQLWGVLKGFGLGAWDMVTGLGDLGTDLWGLATGDAETRAKYANLIQAFREDPSAMLKAMGQGIIAPVQEAWARGDYGEAAGRLLFEIVSAVVGDKGVGKVAKAGKVQDILGWARTADRTGVDEAGQAGRHVELPCVGFVAPAGKVSGLGAPLAEDCKLTEPFDILPYEPKVPGLELHHGLLDVWAKENIPGYVSRGADTPTIALTQVQHAATKAVYREWLFEKTGKRVGGRVDWKSVSPQEMQQLTERMFDAADVPMEARQEYYRYLHQYIYRGGQ